MADPARHPTPAPDDPWPAPDDAAVRQIVEALTAPATPEELADEARYLAAFTARGAPPPAPSGRRIRGRFVLAGAAAALAVTGTAAAVTGTIGRTTTPPETPPTTSAPPPKTSAPPGGGGPSTPPSVHASTDPGRRSTTTGRPTTPPPAAPVPSARPSHSATGPSAPSRAVKPNPSPTPSPSSKKHPPESALRAYCRSYLEGKLKEDSKRYRELVDAAGGADHVREYCEAVVASKPDD
jgi:hypothetical protein